MEVDELAVMLDFPMAAVSSGGSSDTDSLTVGSHADDGGLGYSFSMGWLRGGLWKEPQDHRGDGENIGRGLGNGVGGPTRDVRGFGYGRVAGAGGKAFRNMVVGYNNVDVNAANKYGIVVGNTPNKKRGRRKGSRNKVRPELEQPFRTTTKPSLLMGIERFSFFSSIHYPRSTLEEAKDGGLDRLTCFGTGTSLLLEKGFLVWLKYVSGIEYRTDNQPFEAVNLLNDVILLAPNLHDPYHTLGLIYTAMGDKKKALNFYMIAAHLTPKDSSVESSCRAINVECLMYFV
ncbi:glycerate dehydrogenase [Phtheirospermum japonicum]|uniref:Glycerate dehydrogenase n=1 Tax=Phtheirospermum japonicum TaxID=374723 RepID=A0A830AZ29_9LAMI|nr:glycerate dehydrogenase [Phtheirospermum japonicum]